MNSGRKLTKDEVAAYLKTDEGRKLIVEVQSKSVPTINPSASSTNIMPQCDDVREYCEFGVIGSGGGYESTFIRQYMDNEFEEYYRRHDLEENRFRTLTHLQRRPFKLIMTDMGGARFGAAALSLRGSYQGYIVSYEISNLATFNRAKEIVDHILQNKPNIFCVLLGQNIHNQSRTVNERDARSFARNKNVFHYECNTRDFSSVETVVNNLVQDYRLSRQNSAISQAMKDHKLDDCIQTKGDVNNYHNFRKEKVTNMHRDLTQKSIEDNTGSINDYAQG